MSRRKSGSFEKAVWEVVSSIQSGECLSYAQVAKSAGYPGYSRQVGKAMRTAPSERKLPWHRVIRADGTLAFAEGSEAYQQQRSLLQQEGVDSRLFSAELRKRLKQGGRSEKNNNKSKLDKQLWGLPPAS